MLFFYPFLCFCPKLHCLHPVFGVNPFFHRGQELLLFASVRIILIDIALDLTWIELFIVAICSFDFRRSKRVTRRESSQLGLPRCLTSNICDVDDKADCRFIAQFVRPVEFPFSSNPLSAFAVPFPLLLRF